LFADLGSTANYTFALNAAGQVVVSDVRTASPDGFDTLINMDRVAFGAPGFTTPLLNLIAGTNLDQTLTGTTGSDLMLGFAGNDVMNGNGGNDVFQGGDGNDTLNGLAGNDWLEGGLGDDILNAGTGTDTAIYAGSSSGVTVSLALTAQQDTIGAGLDTLVAVENLTGGAFADTLTGSTGANTLVGGGADDILDGGAGADTLNGGADGDVLIGGAGADTINTGAPNDNIQDTVQFNATTEFGDTVSNFDVNGAATVDDRVAFGAALNTAYDDGSANDSFLFATGNGGTGSVTVTIGQGETDIEALFLGGGIAAEGVSTANLGSAAAVATAFNNEFNITAANGEDALLVINDTNGGNSFALWHWMQANGGEIAATELTRVGTFTANATVTTDNFVFVL
jgi:Ca2+-binding RTX toxin-like protein